MKLENGSCSFQAETMAATITPQLTTAPSTLGHYLACRLVQVGVSDIFSVPGDSNLVLLDYFVGEKGVNLVGCCSELNAGYEADGYARQRGVDACTVSFTVGGLSLINAIAGAYSDDLPVICIVGGPNSNDYGSNKNTSKELLEFGSKFVVIGSRPLRPL